MHPYATDSNERFYVLLALIPLSFWLAATAEIGLKAANVTWRPEADFLADPGSAAFCYLVLYQLFDRWLWKWSLLRWIGLIKIPNLNGSWQATLKSSYNNYQAEYTGSVEIKQTWTAISIRLLRPQSHSYSQSASVLTDAGEGTRVSYEYLNEPQIGEASTMAIHRGTAVQVLHEEKNQRRLRGQYYTSFGRSNVGSADFCQLRTRPGLFGGGTSSAAVRTDNQTQDEAQ